MKEQRTGQGRVALLEHLTEQMQFLSASAEAFDCGHIPEAKRLALSIRLLVHNTNRCTSLLKSLGILYDVRFFDRRDDASTSPGSFSVMATVRLGPRGLEWRANLREPTARVSFDKWWRRVILASNPGPMNFTRRDIVLHVADQDGGAHVDPGLGGPYAALSRNRHFVFRPDRSGDAGLVNTPPLPIVREAAHLLQLTLLDQVPELLGATHTLHDARLLHILAFVRHKEGEHHKEIEFATRGLALAKVAGFKPAIADCCLALAYAYGSLWSANRSDTALLSTASEMSQRAAAEYEELKAEDKQAEALRMLGKTYSGLGRVAEARDTLERSLLIFRDLKNIPGQAFTLRSIGSVSHDHGDPLSARQPWTNACQLFAQIRNDKEVKETRCLLCHLERPSCGRKPCRNWHGK